MSGTSADGIDAARVEFDEHERPNMLQASSSDLEPALKQKIERVITGRDTSIATIKSLDIELAHAFAKAALSVVSNKDDIRAIGSHGQTVLHRPELGFSIQLGSGGIIADYTGIDTINDFRAADLELGGQGAPLVPAFHHSVFTDQKENRVVLNIGGIANISSVPATGQGTFGFDTGPGNTLIDLWSMRHLNQPFDNNGTFAKSGRSDERLLASCLDDPYFQLGHPKSTGRELFNAKWLDNKLSAIPQQLSPKNVAATLVELTARTITDEIARACPEATSVYVCGGGVRNAYLMQRLDRLAGPLHIGSTEEIGLDPAWVECIAFAWLAHRHVLGKPGNLPAVTGARRSTVLGNYWQSSKN